MAAAVTGLGPASRFTAAGLARVAGGAARAFGATARGLALDAAAGLARGGEAAADLMAGRTAGVSTVAVRVLILSDERGRALTTPEAVLPALRRADAIFAGGAGIRVRPAGFETVTDPAPTAALDTRANQLLLLDDILGRTAFFRSRLARRSAWSVVGDPVTVVIVRSMTGTTMGCSLGMTADWVLCRASLFDRAQPRRYDETVLAHELGHALNLPHRRDRSNLMHPVSSPPAKIRGTALRSWQAAILHANRHVVPPA